MKRIVVIATFIFLCFQYGMAKNTAYLEYIETFKEIAISEMNRAGIPASIKLAQGLLESNAGRSYLAVEANNHFGIKCGSNWNGKKKFREDDDYNKKGQKIKSCFRQFPSGEESYYAHSQFLSDPRKAYRYGFLFDFASEDYVSWAKGLSRSGYATNPKYSQLLINLIETYELWQYDHPMYNNVQPSLASTSFTYQINGATVIQAIQGDTPNSIAQRSKISLKQLLKYNKEIYVPGQKMEKGYVVYLQSKRKKYLGQKNRHIVRVGQTIFDISQQYGIFENSIRKRNRMDKFAEAKAGESIYLRGKRSNRDKIKLAPKKTDASKKSIKQAKKPLVPQKDIERTPVSDNHDQVFAGVTGEHLNFYISPRENVGFIARGNVNSKSPQKVEHNIHLHVNINKEHGQKDNNTSEERIPAKRIVDITNTPVQKKVKVYTVSSGDTLYKISRMYDMTVDEIKDMNELANNNLAIGQKIIVR